MSFAALYGTGHGTIGGSLMANLSGPRRIKAGAARDFVLGLKAVSGRGEAFKAGGRVVKNVTGYDLSRGLAGSFGTIAVVTAARGDFRDLVTFRPRTRKKGALCRGGRAR
jgi:glycolate oxidase FAD binding subunit